MTIPKNRRIIYIMKKLISRILLSNAIIELEDLLLRGKKDELKWLKFEYYLRTGKDFDTDTN